MQIQDKIYRLKKLFKITFYCFLFNALFLQIAFAQCAEPDPNIWLNTWVSCEKKANPISEYGQSHWIQYDFGAIRTLSKTWVWNTNDPDKLDQGFKQVKVDYSEDGQNWRHWGEMEFPKAQGKAIYGGFSGPDMLNIKARFVVLTAVSTHGSNCAGLAEVKFNLLPDLIQSPLQFTCENAKAVDRFYLEDIEETEAFINWEYYIPEAFEDEIEFFFEVRQQGMEDWLELEAEENEIFLENLAPGTTYEYRVITFCEDRATFSEIQNFTTLSDVTTNTNELENSGNWMSLSPNPTQSDFILNYFSQNGGQLNYSIKDLQGKTLAEYQARLSPGNNTFMVAMNNLPDGVYLVDAVLADQPIKLVERIVKIGK